MDQAVEDLAGRRVRFQTAISKASMARSERSEFEICQPTTIRENTSMMNAAYTQPGVGLHVGEVGHPQPVRRRRREVALDQVARSVLALVGARGDLVGRAPPGTRKAQLTHEALDRAAGDPDALPVELGPDLVGPIDVEVLGVDPGDLGLQLLVADRPRRRRPLLGHPVGVRGDLAAVLGEHPADRLDPEAVPVCRRCRRLSRLLAVELRPEESRRGLEDFVGPAQLLHLPLELAAARLARRS